MGRSLDVRGRSSGPSGRSPRRARRGRALASTSTSSSPQRARQTTFAVAQVVKPHGVGGELDCHIMTDYPERFERTREVLLGDALEPHRIQRFRISGDRIVIKLEAVDDRTAAEQLRGALLQVPRDQAVALPEGEYFWDDLIGLSVETDGRVLGPLVDILRTGSNDVYVVRTARGELLLPAIKDVIREVDLESGKMYVTLIPGLES